MSEPKRTSETHQAGAMARVGGVFLSVILIATTLYVSYFSQLGAIGLVGPDEPRYAWVARAMAESGDWVTPRLYGQPWFEKPILYYWEAALSFKLFGVSEAAARLPSALSALLATLAMAWLGMRCYGAETARWVLLLLPTTVGMIGFSHAAAPDMPFSAMLTMAMVTAAVVIRVAVYPGDTPALNAPANSASKTAVALGTPWLALVLFGIFLGAAVLAKGPAGVILCGGGVLVWALITRRWRDAFRLLHPASVTAFCATALPWYILCSRRNPDFFRVFIVEHNFKRYLTPEFQHIQPFWFYVPVMLIAFLPWTAVVLWSVVNGAVHLWRGRRIKDFTLLLLCWGGFCLVFFSISQSKLPGYILPSIPALCLLQAHSLAARAPVLQKSFRLTVLGAALLLAILFAIAELPMAHGSPLGQRLGLAAGVVAGFLASANLILGGLYCAPDAPRVRQLAAAFCVVPILTAIVLTSNLRTSFFPFDPSGRSLAREVQVRKIPAEKLTVIGINRGMQYSLSFYLHQEIRSWDQNYPKEGYVLTGNNSCKGIATAQFVCEAIPFDAGHTTGKFLYHVTPASSATGLPNSRQAQ